MRASRLLINSGKTNVMLFATRQKRATNNLKFHLNLEGAIVEEKQCARLLGLKWSNDFSWKAHIEDILQKCSKRLNGLYKVQRELNFKQRKSLVEGAILSKLRYGLEVVSSSSEKDIKQLESMQSKSARYVLGKSRREWSKTLGYQELQWLTMQQTAVQCSLRLFFKVLWSRRPENLLDMVINEEDGELHVLSENDLSGMTKLSRKTWKVRVLRYAEKVPKLFFEMDPNSLKFKSELKQWVKHNIPKEGDNISKGRVQTDDNVDTNDWLRTEIQHWQEWEDHHFQSLLQSRDLLEPNDDHR